MVSNVIEIAYSLKSFVQSKNIQISNKSPKYWREKYKDVNILYFVYVFQMKRRSTLEFFMTRNTSIRPQVNCGEDEDTLLDMSHMTN